MALRVMLLFTTLTLILLANPHPVVCYYKAIFSFGDSLTDTGNLLQLEANNPSSISRFPYGMTYFHSPTGRCSNGRLIIDFIAQALGHPFLPPYLAPEQDFRHGANFAVAGATALEPDSYGERRAKNSLRNVSLGYQIGWFKELLPLLCDSHSKCQDLLNNSLFIVGEIGGNDYHSLVEGRSIEEVKQTIVPQVINFISSSIQTLMKYGGVKFVVPGSVPYGCCTVYLAAFQSDHENKKDYEPQSGCLKRFNEFTVYLNHLLQEEVRRLQELYPHTIINYADYYNAAMQFHRSPSKFGFMKGTLKACCGGGGPYNYNKEIPCGDSGSSVCDDPSLYGSWDGQHLTEAAYKVIADSIIEGPYAIPLLNISYLQLSYLGNMRHSVANE